MHVRSDAISICYYGCVRNPDWMGRHGQNAPPPGSATVRNHLQPQGRIKVHLFRFRFPANAGRRTLWIKAIHRLDVKTKKEWVPAKSSLVCSSHFQPDDFRFDRGYTLLKPTAIPTIFHIPQMKVSFDTTMQNKLRWGNPFMTSICQTYKWPTECTFQWFKAIYWCSIITFWCIAIAVRWRKRVPRQIFPHSPLRVDIINGWPQISHRRKPNLFVHFSVYVCFSIEFSNQLSRLTLTVSLFHCKLKSRKWHVYCWNHFLV
jgi:hypothetical protein